MEWLPIETAPRDGSEILVYFKKIGVRQVSWCDRNGDTEGDCVLWRVDDNKYEPYPLLRGYSRGDDTHWMPLPPPPKATE